MSARLARTSPRSPVTRTLARAVSMLFDPTPLSLLIVVGWVCAIAVVWLRPRQNVAQKREVEFLEWKSRHGTPEATFAQFLGSEEAPSIYLSRWELTAVCTALALLFLLGVRQL